MAKTMTKSSDKKNPGTARCRLCGAPVLGKSAMAKAIRAQRVKERLTLKRAASRLDVSEPTLSRVEHGNPPSLMVAIKIAKWLGQPLEKLWP